MIFNWMGGSGEGEAGVKEVSDLGWVCGVDEDAIKYRLKFSLQGNGFRLF